MYEKLTESQVKSKLPCKPTHYMSHTGPRAFIGIFSLTSVVFHRRSSTISTTQVDYFSEIICSRSPSKGRAKPSPPASSHTQYPARATPPYHSHPLSSWLFSSFRTLAVSLPLHVHPPSCIEAYADDTSTNTDVTAYFTRPLLHQCLLPEPALSPSLWSTPLWAAHHYSFLLSHHLLFFNLLKILFLFFLSPLFPLAFGFLQFGSISTIWGILLLMRSLMTTYNKMVIYNIWEVLFYVNTSRV